MKEEYGYCRISRSKQSIERQVKENNDNKMIEPPEESNKDTKN